jgi:Holliday junction resolvase RusA-like endonuclease
MKKSSENNILLLSDKVEIKPLSVNKAWQGKKFKTKDYIEYEKEVMAKLTYVNMSEVKQPIELSIIVGLSNMASDVDNVVKPFLDILQKKYGFNDKYVFRLIVEKLLVTKGAEFIEFYIKKCVPRHYIVDIKD